MQYILISVWLACLCECQECLISNCFHPFNILGLNIPVVSHTLGDEKWLLNPRSAFSKWIHTFLPDESFITPSLQLIHGNLGPYFITFFCNPFVFSLKLPSSFKKRQQFYSLFFMQKKRWSSCKDFWLLEQKDLCLNEPTLNSSNPTLPHSLVIKDWLSGSVYVLHCPLDEYDEGENTSIIFVMPQNITVCQLSYLNRFGCFLKLS